MIFGYMCGNSTAQMMNRTALRCHYCSIPAQGPTWYLTWYAFDQLTNTLINKFHKWLLNSAQFCTNCANTWHTALWCLVILFTPTNFVQISLKITNCYVGHSICADKFGEYWQTVMLTISICWQIFLKMAHDCDFYNFICTDKFCE